MKTVGFEFKEGARFQPGATKDPKEVGDHLAFLRKHHKGELTPKDVVDDARNRNSPLHPFFEWDNTAAAEAYRLSQARGLIRSVVAIYRDDAAPGGPAIVRMAAYSHISEPGAPHYRETSEAMQLTKTRQLVLQRAWRELQAWRKRYKDLAEFSELFAVVDEVEVHLPKTIEQ